jgi:acyl carrier protein
VVEADWPTVLTYYPRHPRSFAHLAAQGEDGSAGEDEVPVRERLLAAEGAERQQVAEEALLDLVVKVLRVRRAGLEPSVSLGAVGIDSMLATELRNRIELTFGASVSVVDLLGETPISELASRLVSQLDGTPDLAERLAGDGELSQPELEQLLKTADQATVEELLGAVGDLDEAEVARLLNPDG